jgi:hypothetical protein
MRHCPIKLTKENFKEAVENGWFRVRDIAIPAKAD